MAKVHSAIIHYQIEFNNVSENSTAFTKTLKPYFNLLVVLIYIVIEGHLDSQIVGSKYLCDFTIIKHKLNASPTTRPD